LAFLLLAQSRIKATPPLRDLPQWRNGWPACLRNRSISEIGDFSPEAGQVYSAEISAPQLSVAGASKPSSARRFCQITM